MKMEKRGEKSQRTANETKNMITHLWHPWVPHFRSGRRAAQQANSGKHAQSFHPGSNSVCQERYLMSLLYLRTLLGLAKAAPIWGAECLSSQESSNEPSDNFAWIMSDPCVFALCSQGSGYPVPAPLCHHSSQSGWKNKNLNSGKIKTTNELPVCV